MNGVNVGYESRQDINEMMHHINKIRGKRLNVKLINYTAAFASQDSLYRVIA